MGDGGDTDRSHETLMLLVQGYKVVAARETHPRGSSMLSGEFAADSAVPVVLGRAGDAVRFPSTCVREVVAPVPSVSVIFGLQAPSSAR